MDAETLSSLVGCSAAVASAWLPAFETAMTEFQISTPVRQASFFAMVDLESGGLLHLEENLNYSAAGLLATWPAKFNADTANEYGRTEEHPANQVQIANIAYGGLYGNTQPGDGWLFRGRGPFQITFHANYDSLSTGIGADCVTNPDMLIEPTLGALSAAWYWGSRQMNALADQRDIIAMTRAINGGLNGLAQRQAFFNRNCGILGI